MGFTTQEHMSQGPVSHLLEMRTLLGGMCSSSSSFYEEKKK